MALTIEDFQDNVDEIARLYELLLPEDDEIESEAELGYFNSPQYRSKLYKFVKGLTNEQRDIINIALVAGCWLYHAPEVKKHDYLKDLNLQEVHVKDIEKWCAKIRITKEASEYLRTFTKVYLKECL